MQVVYQRCCGIDVHKETAVACVLTTQTDGTVQREVRTFSTMTGALEVLSQWLREHAVEQVAMESTGVFWQPVFNILEEGGHAVLLVNPQHMRAVPGRKTDVADSVWLADLLRHGLLRASFIPPAPIRHLRALTRYRATLVQERAQEINRLQKVLESANIKLAAVATNILGVSGQLMLHALAEGTEQDPAVLAELAKGKLRKKLTLLRQALEGRVTPHHRLLIARFLDHIAGLSEAVEQIEGEIAQSVLPFAQEMALLQTIVGIKQTAAAAILAEIGADMSRFPDAKHLASWAGVCPGNRTSAGKSKGSATTNGDVWLRGILGEVAWAAIRTTGTSFQAQYQRLVRRLGKLKALVAVMHSLLTVIYCVLRNRVAYHELGPDYLGPQEAERRTRQHIRRLEELGYTVTLAPKEVA